MSRLTVLLLYGGRSVEHDISVRSCINVYNYLDKTRFNPVIIGITKSGSWFMQSEVSSTISSDKPVYLDFSAESPCLVDQNTSEQYPFDVVFPVLHGTDGEDGSVQGLFTALNIPVVGSDVLGSAASMNKLVSKQLLTQSGIPNSKYQAFDYTEKDRIEFDKVEKQLGMPVIVKPVNLGSSVGVSKASDEESFKKAVNETFNYDNALLIEEFIDGREFEIAVIGNDDPKPTVPGEVIVSPDYEFYDFNAKYVDAEGATTQIPAKLSPEVISEVQKETIRSYKALQCCDYARVDFFLDEGNNVYINEINTIPGFTNISMFPKLWEYEGLNNQDLISKLIDLCLERYHKKNRVSTDFESELK